MCKQRRVAAEGQVHAQLRSVFASPHDVDVFVGSLHAEHLRWVSDENQLSAVMQEAMQRFVLKGVGAISVTLHSTLETEIIFAFFECWIGG